MAIMLINHRKYSSHEKQRIEILCYDFLFNISNHMTFGHKLVVTELREKEKKSKAAK